MQYLITSIINDARETMACVILLRSRKAISFRSVASNKFSVCLANNSDEFLYTTILRALIAGWMNGS